MKTSIYYLLICICLSSVHCTREKNWSVQSPDEKLVFNLQLNQGELSYNVLFDGTEVIEQSTLGITRDDVDFRKALSFHLETEMTTIEDEYTMITGKRLQNSYKANEKMITFSNLENKFMQLKIRVFNEGVAFRYIFPDDTGQRFIVQQEHTVFDLPQPGVAWMHPYDTVFNWAPAYEQFYKNAVDIDSKSPWNKNGWSFPALFHTNDVWILITDADLDREYCGMHLTDDPVNGRYTLRLPEKDEAFGIYDQFPEISVPWQSPWRVLIIADNPGTVVESNMVHHLSEPNALDHISWIEPGKASWSWWSDSPSPQDYNKLKEFVDFAANMGWEYSLVDANWNEMKGGDLKKLADYARTKNVGLLVWYNSGGQHNVVTEGPRDLMFDKEKRRTAFEKLQNMGIKGIKVDFFQSDKQEIIQQYIAILEDAADFEILVNFHGCTLPRGWSRTYPHLMTMEAVRGAECYKFDREYPDYAPAHNTILPFTRNVVGSMDYTPVTFSDHTYPHITTNAHELALSVVFESGIQHFADKVEAYENTPGFVIDFMKNVPVVWDETKYIDGFPGKYVIIARKSGDKWYVGAINGLDMKQTVQFSVPVDKKKYTFEIIKESEDKWGFVKETGNYVKSDNFDMELPPYGGFVMVLSN